MPVLLAPEIWFVSYCSSDRQVYVYDVRTINPLSNVWSHSYSSRVVILPLFIVTSMKMMIEKLKNDSAHSTNGCIMFGLGKLGVSFASFVLIG